MGTSFVCRRLRKATQRNVSSRQQSLRALFALSCRVVVLRVLGLLFLVAVYDCSSPGKRAPDLKVAHIDKHRVLPHFGKVSVTSIIWCNPQVPKWFVVSSRTYLPTTGGHGVVVAGMVWFFLRALLPEKIVPESLPIP